MNAVGRRRQRIQRGTTLIGTMVGLMLGALTSVAAMSLFRVVTQNAVTAQADALQDGEVSTALTIAQDRLQQAGYGVESAATNCLGAAISLPSAAANRELRLYSGAALDGSSQLTGTQVNITNAAPPADPAPNALAWRFIVDNAGTPESRCSGLIAMNGGLFLLERDAVCNSLDDLPTSPLAVIPLIGGGRIDPQTPITMAAQMGNCAPFDKSAGTAAAVVTISAPFSAADGALTHQARICLPNICRL